MNKSTKCILTIIPLCVLLLVAAMIPFVHANGNVSQPVAVETVQGVAPAFGSGDGTQTLTMDTIPSGSVPSGNNIRTASDLLWLLNNTTSEDTFYLKNDIVITASLWEKLTNYTTARRFTLDGKDGKVNHSITYAPNRDNEQAVLCTSAYGGMFATFSGKLQNLTYKFTNKLEVCANDLSSKTLYYGGLAGIFSGTIDNCTILNQGSINAYANTDSCTIYAGGVAGQMSGATISNSTITISGAVVASSLYETEDATVSQSTLKNYMYAGGIAATSQAQNSKQTTINNSKVTVSGTVYTHDNASKSHGSFGAWLSSIGQSANGDGYIFPAGGLVATATSLTLTLNTINVSAKINATGGEVSSKEGAISGGLVGLSTTGTYLSFSSNVFHLNATLMASHERDGANVYKGGFVGRFDGLNASAAGLLTKNAIYYNVSIVKTNMPKNGTEYYGYLCGTNGAVFKTWNAGSNWMVITGTDKISQVSDIVDVRCTPSVDCGNMGTLVVYGGGSVSAEILDNKMTFTAKQQYSPFYNWFSDISGATAMVHTSDTSTQVKEDSEDNPYIQYNFTPTTMSNGKTVYAVFLTRSIASAGNLVQWTEEMNSGLNRRWVEVELTKDITIEEGVYIVDNFPGKFNGNGHTITFNTTVTMTANANLVVDSDNAIDDVKTVFGITGDEEKKYSMGGLFRIVQTTGYVHDLTLQFSGKLVAGVAATGDEETDAKNMSIYAVVGTLAGCNFGTIENIVLDLPQAARLTAIADTSYVGGLVGINYGKISDVDAVVAGQLKAAAATCYAAALVGADLKGGAITYKNINMDVMGQINGFISSDSAGVGRALSAGMIGMISGDLSLTNVVVNVRDKSNFDGDVLVSNCKHNTEFYQDLLTAVRAFNADSSHAAEDLVEIQDILFSMRSASTTLMAFEQLKADVNAGVTGQVTVTKSWFRKNVLTPTESLDCNAPCASCDSKCTSSYFCAAMNSHTKNLSQVWAIGSFAQYAGDGDRDPGVSVLAYFDSVKETVPTVTRNTYALNLIYVQGGTASGTMTEDGVKFAVPTVDSGHIFTGWFEDYDLSEMAASSLVNGSYFVPGTQSGSVWFSSVINSMITTESELNVLATTTNAGQRYEGITFTLGCNIIAASAFKPIGTPQHYFDGTFDGKGYAIILNTGFEGSTENIGVFGCVGVNGVVKQLVVRINSKITPSGKIFGAVCAINNGTIGQNAADDIRVYVNALVSNVAIGGGVVGINRANGMVQNAHVFYDQAGGKLHAALSGYDYAEGSSVAAGAVAVNLGTVRNTQVTMYKDETINATSGATKQGVKGGVVGYNTAQVYSCVVSIYADDEETEVVRLSGDYAGLLIGNNRSDNVDSLWAVYCMDTSDGFLVPDEQTLLSGNKSDIGNRLIRYGYGNITTEIHANTASQLMGGDILFSAETDSVKKVPFYEYTQSLDTGKTVVGAAGTNYMPTVGSATAGISGKTYYAVFANSEIKNETDFYNFIAHINSGFRAYVDYIVNLSGGTVVGLNADSAEYQSIGNNNNVFVGTFDANNYAIEISTLRQECDTVPLFGTIGATSEIRNLDVRFFDNVNFRTGYRYKIDGENKWLLGAVAYVNLGRIYNLTITVESGLYGSSAGFGTQGYADYAGVVVGYNGGTITNCKVACVAGSYAGHNVAGSVYGVYAGGVAGYNSGTIGSETDASITVNLAAGEGRNTAIVGSRGAGAVVGRNGGTIAKVNATLQGYVGVPEVSGSKIAMGYTSAYELYYATGALADSVSVGGIAGDNAGTIYGVKVTVGAKAVLRSHSGSVGGIAATNSDMGVIGRANNDTVTVLWHAPLTDVARFGGVTADNDGRLYSTVVNIDASVTADSRIGGLIATNNGSVDAATVNIAATARLAAKNEGYAGGLVGYNNGRVSLPQVTVRGYLGEEASGYVGGLAGYTADTFYDGYVVLYHDLTSAQSGQKGIAVGRTAQGKVDNEPVLYGSNVWGVAYNSVRLNASVSPSSGFNVLKVVGKEMVEVSIAGTVANPLVRFVTNMTPVSWYSDITQLTYIIGNDNRPINGLTYLPASNATMIDKVYHLCSYDLTVDSEADLSNLYSYINSADLFYGVAFRLTGSFTVSAGTMIQPIGTKEHPFTGIFDGHNNTLRFAKDSGIVGSEYSGLFGYVADCAVIRDFVLQIDEGVLIGSTCDNVGVLAGRMDGTMENVAINMRSAPYSKTEGAVIGALAGVVGSQARFDNVWISVYNSSVTDVITVADSQTGVLTVYDSMDDLVKKNGTLAANMYNVLYVYGRGVLTFTMNASDKIFTFTVTEGADFFDAWYDSYREGANGIITTDVYGVCKDKSSSVISFAPLTDLHGKAFTSSFISLVIHNVDEFYQFAQNINDYGVINARFTMDLGTRVTELIIDLSDPRMQSIGTQSHPFRSIFDGTITSAGATTGAYTLILQNAIQDADYSGLFGNVGEGAVIRNLVVKAYVAEDNSAANAPKLGNTTSIYTGFLAAAINGTVGNPVTLESVVVSVGPYTTLVNGHADAIGCIAGLWGRYINVTNTWAILPEFGAYGMIGSYRTAEGLYSYVESKNGVAGVQLPSTMYLCGTGELSYRYTKVDESNPTAVTCTIEFELSTSEANRFGFIEKYGDEECVNSNVYTFTTSLNGGMTLSDWHDKIYLALYLKTDIYSAAELQAVADLVKAGRNYRNVVYRLMNDITLDASLWQPIGGSVETGVGSNEYKQVPFIGILDGRGYTITMPQGLYVQAEYAGLFGILSDTAIVRNLYIDCSATIGGDWSQYAGVLAGIDQGATLQNIIVHISTVATLSAKLSTGRVAVNQALVYDVDGLVTNYATVPKASNVWVLSYNSHYTVDQNNAEATFNASIPDWDWAAEPNHSFAAGGSYNGGVNVLTLIANGDVRMQFRIEAGVITGAVLVEDGTKPVVEWYYFDAIGNKVDCKDTYGPAVGGNRELDANVRNQIVYASFVHETIENLTHLIKLGMDVDAGCDLYDITFVLNTDLTINAASLAQAAADLGISVPSFAAIGNANTAFNAIFDGQGHTITLAADQVVGGAYAGLFGVTGSDALLRNLKLVLLGTLGDPAAPAQYAGAVAYNGGSLDSVIIDATSLTLHGNMAGAAFGYDASNLHTNTWLFVKGSDTFAEVGAVANGTTPIINVMKVVGMGVLTTEFALYDGTYYVRMYNNDTEHAILGWYSKFARDNQLSTALNITPSLPLPENDPVYIAFHNITAGDNGRFVAAYDISSCRYEVVIISTVITNQDELIKLAQDVNVGGYTFVNTTFTLGGDIVITKMAFNSIGTAETPFAGTLQGAASTGGSYYTITMDRRNNLDEDQGLPLFGYNNGTIENLLVRQAANITIYGSEAGVIAKVNTGTIANCMVVIMPMSGRLPTISIRGSLVGGIVGHNRGVVQNCIAYIDKTALLSATIAAGGLVGHNDGTVVGSYGGTNSSELDAWAANNNARALRSDKDTDMQWASVLLYGTVEVINNTDDISLYAGGALGRSDSRATVNRLSAIVFDTGVVHGRGRTLEIGGLVGKSLSALKNSTIIFNGTLTYDGAYGEANNLYRVYHGLFVGDIQGSAENSWLVCHVDDDIVAVGNGSSINILQINGKGEIGSYIDRNNNILFYNITPEDDGASIDGWYLSSGISAANIGGIDEDSFAPNRTIMGYTVTVVFISTSISKLDELLTMAVTVNAGLFATDLKFELNADLEVDVDATGLMSTYAIGNATNPFKHAFDGNGHTITFYNAAGTHAAAYLGLFGYTAVDASISNLNVVIRDGNYGIAGSTTAIGALVGVNYGTITNCTVTLGSAATLTAAGSKPVFVGLKVGGAIGENVGTVTNLMVTTYASLRADSGRNDLSANEYVGGVVGVNNGILNDVEATLSGEIAGKHATYSDSTIVGEYTGTSYVGGIVGNNTKQIENVYVLVSDTTISSRSTVLAYAGGICGNNTGSIGFAYVDWSSNATMASDNVTGVAGGIVGANNNILKNILIVYDAACIALQNVDTAVGSMGTYGSATNVWVFNYVDTLDSTAKYINNVTQGTANVTHSDVDTVRNGVIAFYATIDSSKGLTVYANATDGYQSVLLDDFVSYLDASTLKLDAAAFLPVEGRTSISVRAENRRNLQHQSELKAIAKCLADPKGQDIVGVYSVTKDIEVTGDYLSIGTSSRPFAATLQGNMHSVRFADVTYANSGAAAMFGWLSGSVSRLLIRLDSPVAGMQSAGIAWHNDNGTLDTIVVYTAPGVILTNPTYGEGTAATANNNVWVVSYDDVVQGTASNMFGTIVVHGPGSLRVAYKSNTELTFTAVVNDLAEGEIYSNTFAGWSDGTAIVDSALARTMPTPEYRGQNIANYTAEFISTNIATDADFSNLLALLAIDYKGVKNQDDATEATAYYMTNDINVDVNELGFFADFGGILVGNFHTLTLVGNINNAFGSFSAEMRNLIVDARSIANAGSGSEYMLFDINSTATLTNVVFYTSGKYGYLQMPDDKNGIKYNNVYIVIDDTMWREYVLTLYNGLNDYWDSDHVGLLVYSKGALSFGIENGRFVMSTDIDVEGYYFAGWASLRNSGAVVSTTKLDLTVDEGIATKAYSVSYVSANISKESDLASLANAVNAGRAFEGCEFRITGNFTYTFSLCIGNTESTAFAGVLDGGYHSVTTTTSMQPLFGNLTGTVRNLVFYTPSANGLAANLDGTVQNVVVSSTSSDAVFAVSVKGTVSNGCLVAEGGGYNADGTIKGVKVVVMQNDVDGRVKLGRDEETTSDRITVSDGEMCVYFHSANTDQFMVWYDKNGSVMDVGNYNYISSVEDRADYYFVKATNCITTEAEYLYFAKATSANYKSVAYLETDITLGAETLQPLHNVFNLDGQGHTITIQSAAALCVVNKDSADDSSINNLILRVEATAAGFVLCRQTDGNGHYTLNNVVVQTQGNTNVVWDHCLYANVWWLHKATVAEHGEMDTLYATLPDGINVLRYSRGTLAVSYDQNSTVLSVQDAEYGVSRFLGYHYGGAFHAATNDALSLEGDNVSRKRYQAFFVTSEIANSQDWTHNANVMRLTGVTDGAYELTDDVTADGAFVPFLSFDGTLNGNFHRLVLGAGVQAEQVVQVNNGNVQNLAVEVRYGYAVGAAVWFENVGGGSIVNSWIINDSGLAIPAEKHHGARVMTINDEDGVDKSAKENTGIAIGNENGVFVFTPIEKTEYRLHYYSIVGQSEEYDETTWGAVFAANGDITAQFNSCFTITVDIKGIPKALVRAANGDNDDYLSSTKIRWSTDGEYDVEFKDLAASPRKIPGYMFIGFSTTSTSTAISHTKLTKWTVNMDELAESITITANFVQLTSSWSEVVFGDMTTAQIKDYLTLSDDVLDAVSALTDQGWSTTILRKFSVDGDVKGLVDGAPYHAGGYIVSYTINCDQGGDKICLGVSDGLSFRIARRELHFERIDVTTKKYDGTTYATVERLVLGGFSSDPNQEHSIKQQVSTSGISLLYYDAAKGSATANAGTWNLIVDHENSYLASATLNSTVLYDSNYILPSGVIYIYTAEKVDNVLVFTKAAEPYTTSIRKQELEMVVQDISMTYLDQFGSIDANGTYTAMDIHKYFEKGLEIKGFVNEEDRKELYEKASKLLRIVGDETAVDADGNVTYTYYLRHAGFYYIEVIDDALDNYEPRISKKKATLTIQPSAVVVTLPTWAEDAAEGSYNTVQYGDMPTALRYNVALGTMDLTLLAAKLQTATGYGNVNAEDWFGVILEPVAAYVSNAAVSFSEVDVGVTGMQFRFSAANVDFALDEAGTAAVSEKQVVTAFDDANNKCYLIAQDNVLQVTKRLISYQVTSNATKTFGSDEKNVSITGQPVGKALVAGDKLVFKREAGELVGEYAINVSVMDAKGKDVTNRYQLSAYRERKFSITRLTVVVTCTGDGMYYYGSSEIANMKYGVSISEKVKSNIMSALSSKETFDKAVVLTVGYFGKTQQNVSDQPYTNISLKHSYSRNSKIDANLADSCMEFVLDEKSNTYYIVRAPLTVTLSDYARAYDTTVPGQSDFRENMRLSLTDGDGAPITFLSVNVGEYVCDNLSSAAGTYSILPTQLTLTAGSGYASMVGNYTIGSVFAGTYTINSIHITYQAQAGTYDEKGAFTAANLVMFGDPKNCWFFSIDVAELPEYLRAEYADAFGEDGSLGSDKDHSDWIVRRLSVSAAEIGSLPAGTYVCANAKLPTGADASMRYAPYSSDANISLDIGNNTLFSISSVRIELSDVKVTAASVKSRPEVSFTIKAYYVDDEGKLVDITSDYCDQTKYTKVKEGENVKINDALALTVNYSSYSVTGCELSFAPYVLDADSWHSYDQLGNQAVVYTESVDEQGNQTYVNSSIAIASSVTVNPGLWELISDALSGNLALTLAGILGGILLIVIGAVVGAKVYRYQRLRAAVQRNLRNEAIFTRMDAQPDTASNEWQDEDDATDQGEQSDVQATDTDATDPVDD